VLQRGDFSLWFEGGMGIHGGFSNSEYNSTTTDGPSRLGFSMGVLPLLKYDLTDKLSLEASSDLLGIGFLTYTDCRKSGDITYDDSYSYFGMGINAGSDNIKKFYDAFTITLSYKF
jgi:hypothetical protein